MVKPMCFCVHQICLVLGSVVAVIIYRVIAREDLFKSRGDVGLLMASVTSTFINTLSIMIMGKVCILITSYLCDLQYYNKAHFLSQAIVSLV